MLHAGVCVLKTQKHLSTLMKRDLDLRKPRRQVTIQKHRVGLLGIPALEGDELWRIGIDLTIMIMGPHVS